LLRHIDIGSAMGLVVRLLRDGGIVPADRTHLALPGLRRFRS
jgi:hypothetical protein